MTPFCRIAAGALLLLGAGAPHPAAAQSERAAEAFVRVATGYRTTPNVTYHRASGHYLKLDVHAPIVAAGPKPTLIHFHGGGWTYRSKEAAVLEFLPWLEMGWTVVNVAYRLADVAHAPAAVEDCRCALRWVYRNEGKYGFDLDRIVVTGQSAGGHLALTTGMLTAGAGLDRRCPGDRRWNWAIDALSTAELKVAAIVNWYGVTDVVDLAYRPPGKSGAAAEAWLGSRSDRDEVARRVSPMTYVRGDLPPILSIHGDADPVVPYDHGTRLHEALDAAGAPNELVTIAGGGHGNFSHADNLRIYAAIRAFLGRHGLPTAPEGD